MLSYLYVLCFTAFFPLQIDAKTAVFLFFKVFLSLTKDTVLSNRQSFGEIEVSARITNKNKNKQLLLLNALLSVAKILFFFYGT